MYAYQMVQEIERRSNGLFTLPEGTIYPVMYRLTSKGLVSEFTRMINKRLRRYYHLEKDGSVYYEEMLREYKSIAHGISDILESEKGEQHD